LKYISREDDGRVTIYGTSAEDKPMEETDGSAYWEYDTRKTFVFVEGEWRPT